MNIRLLGTPTEVVAALETLRRMPGLTVHQQSQPYLCRGDETAIRVYGDATMDTTQPRPAARPSRRVPPPDPDLGLRHIAAGASR